MRKISFSAPFKRTCLSFFLGALAVLALPPYHFIFVVLISFSGLMLLLNKASTKKQACAIGYAFGAGFYGVGLAWVSNALLIEEMGFAKLAIFPPIGFALWGGFFTMGACLTTFLAPKGIRRLLVFSASWLVFDWVRSWLFTGFPWNMIASIFANTPVLLQTASLFGAYGLGFIVIFVSTLPGYILENKAYRIKIYSSLSGFILILASLLAFGSMRLSNAPSDTINGVALRLVQANIPQGQKWNRQQAEEHLMKHVHLSRAKGAEKITHIIWSETATPFLLAQDEFARSMAISSLKNSAILLTGSLRAEANPTKSEPPFVNVYNSILAFNDIGTLLGSYDKSHLVPFGEYAPLRSVFPFMKKLTPGAFDFETGNGVHTSYIPRTLPVGMLVCYEVIFPGKVVGNQARPYWLLNVTNDGWYGLSAGPYQHFASAQLRAVEEGIPLVRVANTGISGTIDAYGRVIGSLPLGVQGFVDTGLPRRTQTETLYGKYGNTVPLGIALSIIIACFLPLNRRAKK